MTQFSDGMIGGSPNGLCNDIFRFVCDQKSITDNGRSGVQWQSLPQQQLRSCIMTTMTMTNDDNKDDKRLTTNDMIVVGDDATVAFFGSSRIFSPRSTLDTKGVLTNRTLCIQTRRGITTEKHRGFPEER